MALLSLAVPVPDTNRMSGLILHSTSKSQKMVTLTPDLAKATFGTQLNFRGPVLAQRRAT